MVSELYRGRMSQIFWSMKSLHSDKDDVSRFLKITPKLSYYKRVSRSGRTRCLEADGMVWNTCFHLNQMHEFGEITQVFLVCCLICEMRVVMRIQLIGRLQRSNQCISFLTFLTLNFVFCKIRGINPALPTLPVAGSWEKAEAQSGKSVCPRSQNRLAALQELRPGVQKPRTPEACHTSAYVIGTQGCASVGETLWDLFLCVCHWLIQEALRCELKIFHSPKVLDSDSQTLLHLQALDLVSPPLFLQFPSCVNVAPVTYPPKGLCHTVSCLRDIPEQCLLPFRCHMPREWRIGDLFPSISPPVTQLPLAPTGTQ